MTDNFDMLGVHHRPWYICEPDPDGSGWWRAMRSDSDEWFRIPPPPPYEDDAVTE